MSLTSPRPPSDNSPDAAAPRPPRLSRAPDHGPGADHREPEVRDPLLQGRRPAAGLRQEVPGLLRGQSGQGAPGARGAQESRAEIRPAPALRPGPNDGPALGPSGMPGPVRSLIS